MLNRFANVVRPCFPTDAPSTGPQTDLDSGYTFQPFGVRRKVAGRAGYFCPFVGKRLSEEYALRYDADYLKAPEPSGIFGVPLRQSITYANVAISLVDANGKSYIYGYVPIVVAKCGVYLKEKGKFAKNSGSLD